MNVYTEGHTKWGEHRITVHRTLSPQPQAELAIDLIARWGGVAGIPSGEDSAGRSICALQTEEQVVERACKIADLAYAEFERRGWLLHLPQPRPDIKPQWIDTDPAQAQ